MSLNDSSLPWHDERLRRLRDALVSAYPRRQEIEDLVAMVSDLEWTSIEINDVTVQQLWKRVMDRAAASGTLKRLLEAVYSDPTTVSHWPRIQGAAAEVEADRSAAIAAGTVAEIQDPPWFTEIIDRVETALSLLSARNHAPSLRMALVGLKTSFDRAPTDGGLPPTFPLNSLHAAHADTRRLLEAMRQVETGTAQPHVDRLATRLQGSLSRLLTESPPRRRK